MKETTMSTGLNRAGAIAALVVVGVFCGACQKDGGMRPATAPLSNGTALLSTASQASVAASGGSTKGAAGEMPAYYDGQLFTINSVELPEDASAATIAKNQSLNEIFATNDLDDEQDFFPVISAIQGDGFNPLWRQILIVFNPGVTPHQFFSDDEVRAAATGAHPEITLNVTDEVYRCSVVGSK
jgi:hypothetical protein